MCAQESGNPHDPYAVAIKKGSSVVSHVPRKISPICSLFLRATATVTDSRQYSYMRPKRHVHIIIGGLNIGDFCYKSPIAKVYSSPIFRLVRYIVIAFVTPFLSIS